MRKYHSKVDNWIAIVLISSIAVMWLPLYTIWERGSMTLIIGMTLLIGGASLLIASILMNTYYWFDDNQVFWRTGPFKGKLSINQITKVRRAKSFMDISAMVKPCLSSKPLLLHYNKYDDLPVSPKEEKEFLDHLKKAKEDIQISI